MFQFTQQEIEKLRKRTAVTPEVLDELEKLTSDILNEPVLVPKTGIANWYMYYFCPDCSVPLSFNRYNRYSHSCPHCNKEFHGEPYDSAWWRIVNENNYAGAYRLGLLYLLTQKRDYAEKGIAILSAYADYYRGYEVHGNIPYNGPGKLGAQTLDDANFIRNMAMAYDLLEPAMKVNEKQHIKEDLFLPAAEFLMPKRLKQQHNHELIISAAVGMIGLILGREDMLQFAVYAEYGLLYQLEHGVKDSGLWFEGTFGYHFYALEGFFQYERFAVHTKHSHINHPLYSKMLKAAASYAQPDFDFPLLNDTYGGHGTLKDKAVLYEFAYRESGDSQLLQILNRIYEEKERGGIEVFFWGAENLPETLPLKLRSIHPEAGNSGLTVIRGDHERYLLFKQDEFGGEHDHYDRLAISYLAYGRKIAADHGTTGYGAELHYGYYKNSGTHNTVTIGESNQPPAAAKLTRYEEIDGIIYAEASVDWKQEYKMPPIFTIPDWDQQIYEGVSMTRKIAWTDRYFAECFIVEGVSNQSIDWGLHINGEFVGCDWEVKELFGALSQKKPLKYVKDVIYIEGSGLEEPLIVCSRFRVEEVNVKLYSYMPDGAIYIGNAPDNPSVKQVSQIVERRYGERAVFLHVMEVCTGKSVISDVEMEVTQDSAVIRIKEGEQIREVIFSLK
jgi:hypothetical protein